MLMWPAEPNPQGRPVPPAGILQTARSIAAAQLPSGAIPWPDGHVDPWDHVECAMALSACGLAREARLGYEWLAATQRGDGSWPRSFGPAILPDCPVSQGRPAGQGSPASAA